MSTNVLTPQELDLSLYAEKLVVEIENYLADQSPRTAHPLVTKTTAELVAEALGSGTTVESLSAPALEPPSKLLRILPDWIMAFPLLRQFHAAGRQIGVAEHLELTALVIEKHGWARGALRTPSGRVCMLGAQRILYRLGYGDENTAQAAGTQIQNELVRRGVTEPFHSWNDMIGRTENEVLGVIRAAAAHVRSA